MTLAELIKSIQGYRLYSGLVDFEVKGISCNSSQVAPQFLFVAIKGNKQDGHAFIKEAVAKGAGAILLQDEAFGLPFKEKVAIIQVNDSRHALARLAALFYGEPSGALKVVGITGTNGKTTIAYLGEAITREAGLLSGVVGTVEYRFGSHTFPSKNTTPGPLELESLLHGMVQEGVQYCFMEVSSHALDQGRTEGISFSSAIFTNVTQDHLDYHGTLENYFQAKAKLFTGLDGHSFVVINNDNSYGKRLLGLIQCRAVTYGIEEHSDVMAAITRMNLTHTEFTLTHKNIKVPVRTKLIGCHNVYNILASCAWAFKEGLKSEVVVSAIERFDSVPGRLERIDAGGDFFVFVDYAHTEDALLNVIQTLRQVSNAKIIVVFGCGGERDTTKRPKMGRVVTELADYAVITSDNPRSEDPDGIISDIKNGISKNNYTVEVDRYAAIKKAVSLIEPGNILLVAGKGHENSQILKTGPVPFDDREVVKECLRLKKF
jgi:UDP-N-acetylmuramoyl-L-alanyl-D-glutamate--2,6-diaminopimelate ligase